MSDPRKEQDDEGAVQATAHTALHATTSSGSPSRIATTPRISHHRNIVVLSHNVSQDVADGFFDTNLLLHGRVDVLTRCVNAALWVSNNIRKDTTVFLMLFPANITIEIQGWAVENLNPDERTMALYLQRTLMVANTNTGRHSVRGGDTNGNEDKNGGTKESVTEERLSVELFRLQETNRPRPETIDPFERQRLSVARRQRETMMRRIKKATKSLAGNAGAAPVGFVLHQNDSVAARLEQFLSTGPVLKLYETGAHISNVLEILRHVPVPEQHHDHDGTDTNTKPTTTTNTTTLIFGDQIGYTESDEKLLAESGVRQVSLGPISLLTSQCITISHHYLDLEEHEHRC
jgi:tRNA pseudouridine-54 N-methylase